MIERIPHGPILELRLNRPPVNAFDQGLLEPAEALEIGLIDGLAPVERVVQEALLWCETILELPSRAFNLTRELVRKDLVEIVRAHREEDTARLTQEWFHPDLQSSLRALVDRLKGK